MDYLQQLASEWYEYQGYFVRRDLWVGLERDGSYETELDIVAFHPLKHHLVQIEPSLDLLEWKAREQHFRAKFEAGRKSLHRLFGLEPRPSLEQIALIALTDETPRRTVAGGKIVYLHELLAQIVERFSTIELATYLVPEQWPLLRTLQLVSAHRHAILPTLAKGHVVK